MKKIKFLVIIIVAATISGFSSCDPDPNRVYKSWPPASLLESFNLENFENPFGKDFISAEEYYGIESSELVFSWKNRELSDCDILKGIISERFNLDLEEPWSSNFSNEKRVERHLYYPSVDDQQFFFLIGYCIEKTNFSNESPEYFSHPAKSLKFAIVRFH